MDKNLGDKHGLEVIDIFNEDASLNSYGQHYQGKDRFVVRKEIAKELAPDPLQPLLSGDFPTSSRGKNSELPEFPSGT